MKITSITRTIRSTKRLAEIIKVLSAYGFRQVLVDTGIHRLLDREEESPEYRSASSVPRPVRFRKVLEELGPTFIKCGQILSTRPDLIPAEWAEELKKLQDRCTPVPFSEIYDVLSIDFPGRLDLLFSSIEENALAAASMAQVHRATLQDGQHVVIKVLRPGSRQLVEEDMALLESLSQIVEQYFSNLGYSPVAVVKEFSRELSKEINLIYEGQSTDRLRRYFEDDPNIHFPKVHWTATTRNVLTLEEIHGRLLSTISPDSLTAQERRAIVAKGTDAVFKQCLRFGFFHADPHPGNIFLQPDGSICFIDCGMTGQLDRKTTEQLIDLVAGVIRGDIERLCRVVVELTDTDPAKTDRRDFRADLQHLISHFQNADLQHIDISTLLTEFFDMLQSYHLQCPGDLLLLTKALTTIEGVAAHFDPTFDVLSHVEPQIKEIVVNRYGIHAIKDRLEKTAAGYFQLLEDIPKDVQRFLDHVRHRRFTLNLEMRRIEHMADKIDLASRVMGIAMIIAALIVGSSILILADQLADQQGFLGTMGLFGLGLAGIYAAGFVISFLLPKKRK
ncbi:MAG: AarF/ABC1/UbiB kinase family protein [Desulfobulbaceae bacterium]|nr:MAG: AarF/ABC1/UbiB kinase family protein [Desulfobulbaceae bacterium]